MPTFPTLSTGAVMQYPAPQVSGKAVQVIRFLDGSDQRYLTQGVVLRSWQLHLNLLNETEIAQLEDFFASQSGDYQSFVFPDPFSGTLVPNCRFATPDMLTTYLGVDNAEAMIWVVETNG